MTKILDAGYYHIKAHDIPAGDDLDIAYQKDTAYLIHLKPGKALSKPESFTGDYTEFSDPENKQQRYVLIRPREGDAMPVAGGSAETIRRLEFTPTPTEKRTLEYGLGKYGQEIDRVALLVDDLGLPPALSEHLNKLVPEEYVTMLAEAGKQNPLMVSERKARNTGANIVDKRISQIGKNDDRGEIRTPESEYENTGFVLGHRDLSAGAAARSCANGNLVISSPSVIDDSTPGKQGFAVALVRDAGGRAVPSCGVVNTGQIQLLVRDGADEVVAVYHTQDDPNIRFKNNDAAFIYTWAKPDSDMGYTNVTLSADGTHERVQTDRYRTSSLRDKNGTSFRDFMEELDAKHAKIIPIKSGQGVHVSDRGDEVVVACRI